MKRWFKAYERIEVPAQYGTIEVRRKNEDGTITTSTEQVTLREAGIEYRGGRLEYLYETRAERVLIEPSKQEVRDGEQVLIPAKYKTVTKQVVVKSEFKPPKHAVKLITFFIRRDVRKDFLAKLNSEFSEDQVPNFGLFGGDVWYWKEVLAFMTKRTISSPFSAVLKDLVPKKLENTTIEAEE